MKIFNYFNRTTAYPTLPSPLDAAFNQYPAFKTLYNGFLRNGLTRLDHKLEFCHLTNEPILLLEGQKKPWSEIYKELMTPTDGIEPFKTLNRLPKGWIYNDQGFVKRNQVKWVKLEPDFNDTSVHAVTGKCFIEVLSESYRFSQHCWIRLIDENKKVISVGYGGKVHNILPFRKSRGFFFTPDEAEFRDHYKFSVGTRFLIDKATYGKLKEKIEKDQNEVDSRHFNLRRKNCSVYTCEVLKEIGIEVNNKEFLSQALGRRVSRFTGIKIPISVQHALEKISQFFRSLLSPIYAIGAVILGNLHVDKSIKNNKNVKASTSEESKSWYRHLQDFFRVNFFLFNTGWKFTNWQKAVEKVRAVELEKLRIEAKNIDFSSLTLEEKQAFEERVFQVKYGIPEATKIKNTPLGFVPVI